MPDYFGQYGYKAMAVGKIYHQGDGAESFEDCGSMFDGFGPKPAEHIIYNPSKIEEKVGYTNTDWGAFSAQANIA